MPHVIPCRAKLCEYIHDCTVLFPYMREKEVRTHTHTRYKFLSQATPLWTTLPIYTYVRIVARYTVARHTVAKQTCMHVPGVLKFLH